MSKKMLIDASHPEETRVAVVNGSRIDELDFESEKKRQLRGNVYLARVTRVEPSLQAAFVEYGGNRHGFLAFSEIHPDYYQIPYEDRMALLEAEEAENIAEDEDEDIETTDGEESDSDENAEQEAIEQSDEEIDDEDSDDDEGEDEDVVEEQANISSSRRKRMSRRRYKIQEVIKRGQILLIQVVKEERGNKGAAMTTYLSLAGRYCVLMPNTPRGGGISRKIANGADRKRLKGIVSEFEVPQGMGVIVRTAGAKRTKLEIKRDYDYLSRLWETTRDNTLKSIAPALIHEEGNLVKRSIRDLYNKDIKEVLVQGDEAYKAAKAFIKMLMPSHAKNVKAYKDPIPLFLRYQVESQLEDSMNSVVQLKSGGYLVIHPTEALVSVDVNSGRSTKERNVERTALKTNLEAAEEVARQMRLRDLAGLIVIDFIDMDENRNNRAVEKRMKEALAQDRARVQNSRISQFGLMEISRQRRRRSLLEGSTAHCEHCQGVGRKRTVESSALRAIRAIEETGARGQAKRIKITVAPDVVFYLINEKRELLRDIDTRYQMFTEICGDASLIRPEFTITVLETRDANTDDPLVSIEKEIREQDKKIEKSRKKPSRTGKQKNDDKDPDETKTDNETEETDEATADEESGKRRRRRGRRGGRRRKSETQTDTDESTETESADEDKSVVELENQAANETDDKPKKGRRKKSTKSEETDASEDESKPAEKPKRKSRTPKKTKDASVETESSTADTTKADTTKADTAEKKPVEKPRSTTRRKAPTRKPKGDTEAQSSEETKADSAPKPKSTKRKKAPGKPKGTSDKAKGSKAKKNEPAEAQASEDATTTKSDKPIRSTTRRKAPTRKKPVADTETATDSSQESDASETSTRKSLKASEKTITSPKEKASKQSWWQRKKKD